MIVTIQARLVNLSATLLPFVMLEAATRFAEIVSDDLPIFHVIDERNSSLQNSVVELYGFFGASEATIFSNRESPRSGLHSGCNFSRP